jgi:hypothetical protein
MSKDTRPFWQQLRDHKLKAPKPAAVKRQEKEAKGAFFADAVLKAPKCCENCGKSLAGTKAISPSAIVCHILPKSEKTGFPSVALHPMNKWYGCGDCHTDYDNKGAEFVQSMPIFPALVERVAIFYNQIAPAEQRRVPAYFRPKE